MGIFFYCLLTTTTTTTTTTTNTHFIMGMNHKDNRKLPVSTGKVDDSPQVFP